MLAIEILKSEKNVTLGSAVLRSLQNEHSPKIDLLIRESIQNSLDAAEKVKIPGRNDPNPNVDINFIVGDFESSTFAGMLDVVGEKLLKQNPGICKFLSISDMGTMGLTGPLSHAKVVGQNFGNMVKLVYDISKPQEQEGAGGSWGIGKTIFYRMGMGLVIYYTRIRLAVNKYEERLAIVMVEDEGGEKTLIPAYGGTTKSGVAWWGRKVDTNLTEPITDGQTIEKILKIFSIRRYDLKQTGTTIVIPYIDEQEILQHNEIFANNERGSSEILNSLEFAVELAVQRWYTPRLNNSFYNIGNRKNLIVTINNRKITEKSQHPYYSLLKDMYNYAFTGKPESIKYFEDINKINREEIKVNNGNGITLDKPVVGYLSYGIFDYDEVGMGREFDPINPHFLSNISESDINNNTPIVTFVRRPGMLVNYKDKGEWANKMPISSNDKYIIAIFVLNSSNTITIDSTEKKYSLEEYIRQSEASDHLDWNDHTKFGTNPKIVSRIQRSIVRLITKKFEKQIEELPTNNDGRLSKAAAKLVLPPTGYGNKATKVKAGRAKVAISSSRSKGVRTELKLEDSEYSKNLVQIPVSFQILDNNVISLDVDLIIRGENGEISIDNYEKNLLTKSPLLLKSLELSNNEGQFFSSNNNSESHRSVKEKTTLGTVYSITLTKDFYIGELLKGFITIEAETKELSPVIKLKSKMEDSR